MRRDEINRILNMFFYTITWSAPGEKRAGRLTIPSRQRQRAGRAAPRRRRPRGRHRRSRTERLRAPAAAAPRGWAVAVGSSRRSGRMRIRVGLAKKGWPESEPRSVGAAAPARGTRLRTTCVSVAMTNARPALTRSARERLSGVRGLRGGTGAGGARHSLPAVRGLSPRRAHGPRGTDVLRAWPREQVFRTSLPLLLHRHILSLSK